MLHSYLIVISIKSRDSSPGIALGYGLDDRGSQPPPGGWEFFSSPSRPKRFWGPPRLLSNGYQGLFTRGWSGRGAKLTTHLHLLPRSKISGTIPPLPQYVFMAWCSVQKKHRKFTFVFIYFAKNRGEERII